jgi:nicotinamide-nucleotide amidase
VSEPVALAMAEGVRRRMGATIGVGVTGVAGPSGGTAAKPVGMVCVAVSSETHSQVRTFNFPGDRHSIRSQTAQAALEMVRQVLSSA